MAKNYIKAIATYSKYFEKYYDENKTRIAVARDILKNNTSLDIAPKYLSDVMGVWLSQKDKASIEKKEKKTGLEMREDYVLNWSNHTIITDLGVYGSFVTSFNKHQLIQRAYVYDHGDETAAIVAMEFGFPHMKSVYKYAKIHGFTKASPGQTDLELEMGLTVEDAIEENLQSKKLEIYKKTKKRQWKETQEAADRYWQLESSLKEQMQSLFLELNNDKSKAPIIKINAIEKSSDPFAAFIGITDIHYAKLCYDAVGTLTYNRDIARERLQAHIQKLAEETFRYGTPERFYLTIGNDGIHIDGMLHATTRGTMQQEATDGLWRLELKNYFRMIMEMIEYYKAIAPVTVIPVKGNHDYQTTIALQSFIELYYEKDDQVETVICHDPRSYVQYGNVCLVNTHGDEMGSVVKLENSIHRLVLTEAQRQGIDVEKINQYLLLNGHEHAGSYKDLGGKIQRIGMASMACNDDYWHKAMGFVGAVEESQVIILDPKKGRKAMIYV